MIDFSVPGQSSGSVAKCSSWPSGVRRLQERAARALPADHVEDVDGWWLRHAPTCSWWVSAVLPHAAVDTAGLAGRIAGVERFYAERGAAVRFQISPSVCPQPLDTVLAERGYRRTVLGSLRVASTEDVLSRAPGDGVRVHLADRPSRVWFEALRAVHATEGEWDMLGRVALPTTYASVLAGDDVVAVGRAVADTGWAGVFSMATLPAARGRGAARAVLAALADWARGHGAGDMYLQMERDNVPALRLYERMGFREICGYHYRVSS